MRRSGVCGGERDGVEVQQVGLDGEGCGTEGGADADVGDGLEGFGGGAGADGERGDVDAVGGKQLRVGREVDGGNGVASAEAAAGGGRAVDGEGAAEQGARLADAARGDEGANAAGGDGAAAQAERVVDGDGEAEFAAQGLQAGWAGDAGLGLVAKAEVGALVDLGDVEGAGQDAGGEVAGGAAAKLVGEGEDQGGVDAGGGEQFQLAGQRSEEEMRPLRVEDAGRMGIEGDGEGLAAEKAGARDDLGDDSLMAEMHAVEVADGGDDGGGRGGQFGELAVGFQVVSSRL